MPFFNRKNKCEKQYKFGKTLGTGSFATVVTAIHKKDKTKWAIKCIKKANLTAEDKDGLEIEVKAMESVQHPNIVVLKEVFDTEEKFYMVLEQMNGGELFDRIVEKEKYTEGEAQVVIKQMADALLYCHNKSIVHRDLKPENVLYATKEEDSAVKIADFGLAKIVSEDVMMKTACGTPGYVAPEILLGEVYSDKVDVWSVGVIAYILLCGFPPFYETNNAELFKQIKAGAYDYPSPYWDGVSTEAKEFINQMLTVDATKRISMKEVAEHPWVNSKNASVSSNDISGMLSRLEKYQAKRKFKAGMMAAAAVHRMHALTSLGDK